MLLVGLLALVALATGQATHTLADRAAAISRLAYSPTEFKHLSPREAHQRGLDDQRKRTAWYESQVGAKFPARNRQRAARINAFSKQLKIVDASRDVVAYEHTNSNGEKRLIFGYRGTALASDLIPDAQLAVNAKRIKRLDQARAWTKRVRQRHAHIPNEKVEFHGHSLGGFIAEGVGNDYPGSSTATLEAGAPILRRGSAYARAFNPRKPGSKAPVRFVRMEDPVPLGEKNLGPGARVIRERRVSVLNPIKNHFLANNIPWYKAPIPDDQKKPGLVERSATAVKKQYVKTLARTRVAVDRAKKSLKKASTAVGKAIEKRRTTARKRYVFYKGKAKRAMQRGKQRVVGAWNRSKQWLKSKMSKKPKQ